MGVPRLDKPVAFVLAGPEARRGPYSLEHLINEVLDGRLAVQTAVWWPGLKDWTTFGEHDGLAKEVELLRSVPSSQSEMTSGSSRPSVSSNEPHAPEVVRRRPMDPATVEATIARSDVGELPDVDLRPAVERLPDMATNPTLCESVLTDILPADPQGVRALVLAVDVGIVERLRQSPVSQLGGLIAQSIQVLRDNGVRSSDARWSVTTWSHAFGSAWINWQCEEVAAFAEQDGEWGLIDELRSLDQESFTHAAERRVFEIAHELDVVVTWDMPGTHRRVTPPEIAAIGPTHIDIDTVD